jgi:plastocyanin
MRARPLLALVAVVTAVGRFAACGGGAGPGTTPSTTPPTTVVPPSADVLITIAGIAGSMSYDPNPATVRVGQTVAWRNADDLPHTASQTGAGGFETGTIAGRATSAPIRMTTPGSLPYFCRIHPSMVATLVVSP